MLRRISPIHKQGGASREQRELMESLSQAQAALQHAYLSFDTLSDPELDRRLTQMRAEMTAAVLESDRRVEAQFNQ